MTGHVRYWPARRGLHSAILAMAVTSWRVIPASGQNPAASVGTGEPSPVTESAPGELASVEDLPLTRLESSQASLYYWNSIPLGDSAQLLTLFCRACNVSNSAERDVPLVSVLRDTLGDHTAENDRVTYVVLANRFDTFHSFDIFNFDIFNFVAFSPENSGTYDLVSLARILPLPYA
jgi:hypothetical protein